MVHMRPFNKFEERNLTFLTRKSIECTLVQITATGYKKSILDATEPMRQYFKDNGVHDYACQEQGVENKVSFPTIILDEASSYTTITSLYRPVTKKGDPRLWPNNLKKHCQPDDILMIFYHKGKLHIVNISATDIAKVCASNLDTPLKDLIAEAYLLAISIADELTSMLRSLAAEWHPADVLADTGIGRAIERLLGINMNSSKLPDYKGIELKSYRDKRPNIRSTLFCQVPDWEHSYLHSAKAIVEKYGYFRLDEKTGNKVLTYQNTLCCTTPNSQNLGLTLYPTKEILAIEEKAYKASCFVKVADVALWQLPLLHARLLEKHHETFWIEVETRYVGGVELFRPTKVEYTKNPVVSQFDNLLDAGYISVDLLLSRPSGNGDTIAFKIKKQARSMLFPQSEQINLL